MTRDAARLAVVHKLHAVELELARAEHARAAAALVRGKVHALGNAIQVARLASLQLEQRCGADVKELIADLVHATEQANIVLSELIMASQPEDTEQVSAIAPVVRAAVRLGQPAIEAPIELAVELADDVRVRASDAELEALVLALALDAGDAARVRLHVRARTIGGKHHVQLVRWDDRADAALPALVDALATHAGGEASIGAGREGTELAIELPVA